MANRRPVAARKPSVQETLLRLYALSPEVQASLEKLRKRYGKHAMPASELRKLLDKQLGDRTLTEELYKLRQE